MRICIFEDTSVADLSPLNYFRHTSELICGSFTLAEKIYHNTGRKYKLSFHCRKYLQDYLEEKFSKTPINSLGNDDYLFLNSRVIYSQVYLEKVLSRTKMDKNFLHSVNRNIVSFHVSSGNLSGIRTFIEAQSGHNLLSLDNLLTLNLNKLSIDDSEIRIVNYPWDLI